MNYLITKIHTTGLNPDVHSIFSISCILLDSKQEEIGRFFSFVDTSKAFWEKGAEDFHKDIFNDLGDNTSLIKTEVEILKELDYLISQAKEQVIIVGYEGNFEYNFIQSLYRKHQWELRTYHHHPLSLLNSFIHELLNSLDLYKSLKFKDVCNVLNFTISDDIYYEQVENVAQLFKILKPLN